MAEQLTSTRPFRLGALLLVLVFAIAYALTIDTGLQPYELHGGDLITHQYAQVQARPSNAPGYPLYTMGGWLWFHGWRTLRQAFGDALPNPTPILSSYSTLWALLALWLFYQILGSLLNRTPHVWIATIACWLAAAFYGTTYFFWYYATTTEQYSSAIAQTLAIFYLFIQWDRQPARRILVYALALLCGISLAHMLTVAFIVPPLVAIMVWRDPSLLRSPRPILLSTLAAALPLLSYVYVYLRGALHPNWWGRGYWQTPQAWFWEFVSTSQGREELGWAFEPGRPFFGNGFPQGIWAELSLPLLVLGLSGVARLPRRHALLIYATLLLYTLFCWLYRFGNWFQVILPAYPLILLGLVPWLHFLLHKAGIVGRAGRISSLATLVAFVIWRIDASLPATDSRYRPQDTALDRAAVLLDQPLPRDARVFAAVDDALAISYLTEIWQLRPDVKTLNSRDADDDIADGATVFATMDATPALLAELHGSPMLNGFSPDWNALSLQPAAPSTTIGESLRYTVTPDLILAGYTVMPTPTGAPLSPPLEPALDVHLVWHLPGGVWPASLSISLRPTVRGQALFDPATGQPIQQDYTRPLRGLWMDKPVPYPLSNPVVIHDPYRVPNPPAAGADSLLLILYTQTESGFDNLAEITLPPPGP